MEGRTPRFSEVFVRTSVEDANLFACSQAGLVNNLNDGMAWACFRSALLRLDSTCGGSAFSRSSILRSHPQWRASAVGVYRLWRDLGYAVGALLSGIAADLLTYRHAKTGAWVSVALEYGSGTPTEAEEPGDRAGQPMVEMDQRVPGHVMANLSLGADIWHGGDGKRRLAARISIENVTNKIYKIAQENVFTPGQYSIPRLVSGGLTLKF